MAPLRIAQVMASGPVQGGLEKHFVDLCAGLSRNHRVLAIADPFHVQTMPAEVEFCPFNFSGSRRNPLTMLRVHRLLKSFRPHVIHAQANKAAGVVAAIRHFQSAKLVATIHGFKNNNRVFGHFDAVICVSSSVKERFRLSQSVVIPNGIAPLSKPIVDPNYFAHNFGLSNGRPIVVAAGRLAPVKGYAGLISAWRGIEADLVIAGEGPERPELESLIEKLRLGDRVHLIGYRRDVPELMTNADLLVISSEREGFPYAMVEALHLEKVMVSTRFPGASDFLPEKFLVPYGDEQVFRRCIEQTLRSLEQARVEYAPIWHRAKMQLTIDRLVEQTSRVYANILKLAA
jgi:glycosyltransferase involved in cell wall biosynthesis